MLALTFQEWHSAVEKKITESSYEMRRECRVQLHSREATEGKPYLRVKCWFELCPSTFMKTGLEQPLKENTNSTNGYERVDGARNPKIMMSGRAIYTVPANSYARQQ